LKDQQEVDKFKNEYSLKNGIILIRIPYFEFNNINNNYLKNKINE